MAWYCAYLKDFDTKYFSLTVVLTLGFEIIYIAIQSARGQMSYFNVSTPLYGVLYFTMAAAASIVTFYTAYFAYLFFVQNIQLPEHYLWSIRSGLILFVIFSFQGFLMGSRMSHAVSGSDAGAGIPFLNWKYSYGDLRIAHFVGMHALQIIPLLAFYIIRNSKGVIVASFFYFILSIFTLVLALQGRSFFGR